MLLKRFSRSQRVKMSTHRAPSGQELWHLGEAVFPGHYRRLWGLTPDPQGVRAKAAMVCSCHATRCPAEMPVCNLNGPANFTHRASTKAGGCHGKSDGWKITGREIREERRRRNVSWPPHTRLFPWELIGRTGSLEQFSMVPCLQLKGSHARFAHHFTK